MPVIRDLREPPARRRSALVLLVALGVLASGLGVVLVAVAVQLHRLDERVVRVSDPFAGLPDRPRQLPPRPGEPDRAVDVLLLGTDTRLQGRRPDDWVAGAQRTDAILLVHLPADRSAAYVVSIPRDAWVPVPGHGMRKINAAFSLGGPPLAVQTVEQLTGVRIEHYAMVDFAGFQRLTDLLGGIEVTGPDGGRERLDGDAALAYVRERKTLPGGDLDRVRRQQAFLRGVLDRLRDTGVPSAPLALGRVLDATADLVAVDEGTSRRDVLRLARAVHGLPRQDVVFTTVPVSGLGTSRDGQSIVLLDERRDAVLWEALRSDRMRDWVAAARPDVLDERVR